MRPLQDHIIDDRFALLTLPTLDHGAGSLRDAQTGREDIIAVTSEGNAYALRMSAITTQYNRAGLKYSCRIASIYAGAGHQI